MKFIFEYSIKENLRKKWNFLICLIACFLVSFICLVLKTIIRQGTLIFLIISEKESGEMDFYLTPKVKTRNSSLLTIEDYHRDNAFINFTKFEEVMKKTRNDNEEEKNNPFDTSVIRTYFSGYSPYNELYLTLIDTEREKEIELGRYYPYTKLKEGECLVHKNLIINEKKKFNITILMNDFITNTLLYNYHDIKNEMEKKNINPGLEHLSEFNQYITFTCDIVDTLNDTYGKEKGDDDNIVIMEQEYFYNYISNFIPKEIVNNFPDYLNIVKKIKPEEYGNALVMNFPKNRLNYYMEDDYDILLDKGVRYMNNIVKKIGSLNNYDVKMPLIEAMRYFQYGNTLLNLILNLILIGIFGLSIILIHSLLLITTETHSFEFGALRLVGNSKKNVILIIIIECICFSIPAFFLALFFSYFAINIINDIIKDELKTDLNISLTLNSFIMALILNFLGPILSAIFPIRNILRKNIANSLNTILNKTQGMKIEVVSLQQKELVSLIIFGLITFIYGASIYYFLPLSLISFNFGMIGAIFLWILYGILLGFTLLSRNIEQSFLKLLTKFIFFFSRTYTKLLILKNLAAHRLKNKKTSLMFSLSVGIFIMTSVGFDLIIQSTKNMIVQENGSEITVCNKDGYLTPGIISNSLMELYNKKLIDSFSLYTVYLNDICLGSDFYISNYGKTIDINLNLLAINSAFISATSKNDLKISEQFKKYKRYSPSEQLYFSDFKGKVGISGILNYQFNVHKNTEFLLKFVNTYQEMIFLSKPAFILNAAGGLIMTDQPSYYETRETIISIPLYLEMLQKCRNYFSESFEEFSIINYKNIPIWGINIKPKDNATPEDIELINSIIKLIGPKVEIWFFANLKNRLNISANIVFFIFYVVSTIILIFCIFNLTASMTINIYQQDKEIAIFRALGAQKRHIFLIYIAESFLLVLSSSIIGILIGGVISYTMALQWGIFTNVNVSFNFPFGSITIIIFFSIFGAILSTYFPARNILKKPVAELIRTG